MRPRFLARGLAPTVALLAATFPGAPLLTHAAISPPFQLVAPNPPGATGPDAQDVNFRKAEGFDTSLSTIDQLKAANPVPPSGYASAPGTPGGPPQYGVVLSAAEQQEMNYRVQTLEPAMLDSKLRVYLTAHADTFGGMYLDGPGGGKVTILFTADVASRATDLQSIFTAIPSRLVVRQVSNTDAALTATYLKLSADLPSLSSLGIDAVSVDPVNNAVVLAGPGASAGTVATLQSRYPSVGVSVLVKLGPAVLSLNSTSAPGGFPPPAATPMPAPAVVATPSAAAEVALPSTGAAGNFPLPFVGGESMGTSNANPTCTLGFLVTSGRAYYGTTAGHCTSWQGTGLTYTQSIGAGANPPTYTGNYMGQVEFNNAINPAGCLPTAPSCTTNSDSELIDVGAQDVSTGLIAYGYPPSKNIVGEQGQNGDPDGSTVCQSGWRTDISPWQCGTVIDYRNSSSENCACQGGSVTVQWLRSVQGIQGLIGDSGAPVVSLASGSNYIATGTVFGSCDGSNPADRCNVGYYGHIYDLDQAYGVHVVTSPGYYQMPVKGAITVAGLTAGTGSLYIDAVDGTVRRMDVNSKSWETLPPVPSGANGNPAALLAVGSPREDVFIRGNNGYLYHNWHPSGANGGWSWNWEQMPYAAVGISSDPTLANEGVSGVIDVFARAADGYLYQWRQSNFGGWGAHEYFNGATVVGNPAAQSWSVPGFHVYWRGADNNLWETYNSTNYPADTLASGLSGDPMPLLNPGGDWNNVVFRGSNGTLHNVSWSSSSGWSPNADRGIPMAAGSDVGATDYGSSIYFSFTDSSGNVHLEQCCTGGWTDGTLPNSPAGSSSPVPIAWAGQNFDVFFRKPGDDSVSDTWYNAGTGNWNAFYDNPPAGPRW